MNVERVRISIFLGLALALGFSRTAHAVTTTQYAVLAELVYFLNGDPNMSKATVPSGFTRLATATDSKSGFKAAAYAETATKAVVVSYAGTDDVHDVMADLGVGEEDIASAESDVEKAAASKLVASLDHKLAKSMERQSSRTLKPNADLAAQIGSADKFYDDIAAKYPGRTITITGHSLGGYLGQLVASRTGAYAVLFNAPGAYDLSRRKSSNMLTYVRKYDVVGNLGKHIGRMELYREVELRMLNVKTRYVVRNHSIVEIRKDLEKGMTPLK